MTALELVQIKEVIDKHRRLMTNIQMQLNADQRKHYDVIFNENDDLLEKFSDLIDTVLEHTEVLND